MGSLRVIKREMKYDKRVPAMIRRVYRVPYNYW